MCDAQLCDMTNIVTLRKGDRKHQTVTTHLNYGSRAGLFNGGDIVYQEGNCDNL